MSTLKVACYNKECTGPYDGTCSSGPYTIGVHDVEVSGIVLGADFNDPANPACCWPRPETGSEPAREVGQEVHVFCCCTVIKGKVVGFIPDSSYVLVELDHDFVYHPHIEIGAPV